MSSYKAPMSTSMIAFQQTGYSRVAKENITRATDAPIPRPQAGELLIRVKASGLNAGDVFMGRGGAKAVFKLPFPCTIGRDVAGIVEEIAAGTKTTLQVGDHIVGYLDVGKGRGTFGEYCVLQEKHAVRLPDSVKFVDAAALPTAGCTTWQALVGRKILKMGAGQRILILGGSTGNGTFAIQLAKAYGCTEIATTSSQVELCTSLGATRVINHRAGEKWEEALAGAKYDIIYDCIEGLPAWRKAPAVLKPSRAKFVSIVMDDAHADARPADMLVFVGRVISRWFWSWLGYPHFVWHINIGSSDGLAELVAMVADGRVRAALDGAPRPSSWEGFVEMWDVQMAGRAHGKFVMEW